MMATTDEVFATRTNAVDGTTTGRYVDGNTRPPRERGRSSSVNAGKVIVITFTPKI
jgi:hypothetical protein